MVTLKLTLDKRKAKKNGSFPVVFRISINGEVRDIKTGYSLLENEWNLRTESLSKTHPLYEVVSEDLKELKVKYLSKILEYEKSHPWHLTAQELRDYILAEHKTTTTVYDFWQQEIDLIQKANRNGGARIYMETLVALNKVRSLHIRFEQINYQFLKEVEAELLSKEVKINSISLYFRTLRAIYNKPLTQE